MRDSSKGIMKYGANYPNLELVASAKTIAVKNQILMWQKETTDDKIISRSSLTSKTLCAPADQSSVFVNWVKLGTASSAVCYTREK
jgi:hypothetical protein